MRAVSQEIQVCAGTVSNSIEVTVISSSPINTRGRPKR